MDMGNLWACKYFKRVSTLFEHTTIKDKLLLTECLWNFLSSGKKMAMKCMGQTLAIVIFHVFTYFLFVEKSLNRVKQEMDQHKWAIINFMYLFTLCRLKGQYGVSNLQILSPPVFKSCHIICRSCPFIFWASRLRHTHPQRQQQGLQPPHSAGSWRQRQEEYY